MAKRKSIRPTREGHLRLSLVTCPVAIYSAAERTVDVRFNLINLKTNDRIRVQTIDDGTGKAVDRADPVRRFAASRHRYVLREEEDLDAVRVENTRILDIEQLVDRDEVALRDFIARRKKGQPVVSEAPEFGDETVVDLMEALRKSLKGSSAPTRDKSKRFLEAHGRQRARRPRARPGTSPKTAGKAQADKRAA